MATSPSLRGMHSCTGASQRVGKPAFTAAWVPPRRSSSGAATTQGVCAFSLTSLACQHQAFLPVPSTSRRTQHRCQSLARPHVNFFGFGDDPDPELSIVKLQVAVFGKVSDFQRRLDRIASRLDTDDEEAMHELVQEFVVLLGRNMEYCSYGGSASVSTDDLDDLERKFNSAVIKERQKFKAETLSNVRGRVGRSQLNESGTDVGLDRWLVITLILAAEAPISFPKVRSNSDLRKALTALGGLSPDDILATELLWTPQEEGDSYSKEELLQDYPTLANL